MATNVSPLDLVLDPENPRFIILASRGQAEIRKYLATYEDVCQLTSAINEYGSLLPGERIVVLQENDQYIVIEGNRRTCALQFLLSRDLIPGGFVHKIPATSAKINENCQVIEVDVLPDRSAALELMTKRHIEGVKQWKPLAKKQFFAANYGDGQGQSIQNLSRITGIKQSEIKQDIRDYKLFLSAYEKYRVDHPDFVREIITLKTDPFWRIFKAKFEFPAGNRVSPTELLRITHDETLNTISALEPALFEQITQLVFEKAIVGEEITTRNVLTDVDGILPLLQIVYESAGQGTFPGGEDSSAESAQGTSQDDATEDHHGETGAIRNGDSEQDAPESGGPLPGGPPPKSFFETISWHGRLNPSNPRHQGLLYAINELYNLSNANCGGRKAYKAFPVATGMILRTVYEQALRLRLMQVNLWGAYMRPIGTGRRGSLPTLSTMENFINQGTNKASVFPDQDMVLCFDRVIAATHRDYLNANIHCPGDINVTSDALESIAAGGMYALIQGIINLI